MTLFKYACLIAGLLTGFLNHAMDSKAIEQQADKTIQELYHRVRALPNTSMAQRINWFSAQFLGIQYLLGSLGEGATARFDQFPRYRVDAFDCDTYVNTVLALVLADSLKSFQHCILLTRYENGMPSYIHRNHFTSIDWNQNNQRRGLLKDITLNITDENNKPAAIVSNTPIDKSAWYAHKTASTIRLNHVNELEQEKRLLELKTLGSRLGSTQAKIPYLPFTKLFVHGKPNRHLFSQIPQGAVVEIIRPNWDLRQQIGTFLDVSHLGFAIWIKGKLYFREAATVEGHVMDIPLIDYLQKAKKNPTIKGINVQVVVAPFPMNCIINTLEEG